MNEQHYIARTCTEKTNTIPLEKKTLKDYRHVHAYILLGDSGAGKTIEFKHEAQESGGEYIIAQDFIDIESKERNKPLFIDGLDEIRANFGKLRHNLHKLAQLNIPFRLSCREAEWQGETDREAIKRILPPNLELITLHLDPLTNENIKDILKMTNITDPDEFLNQARQHHLEVLLKNPHILDLLIKSVGNANHWPDSRKAIYEQACHHLMVEERRANNTYSKDKMLNAAEYLCAIQLLSGLSGFALYQGSANNRYYDFLDLNNIENLSLMREALGRNIFRCGEKEEQRQPAHKSIAEYLSAKYLAKLIEKKENPLPIERVLALMSDETGIISSALRGLYAWLSVHCITERKKLIMRDPLGIIVYGDVRDFTLEEKKLILDTIKTEEKHLNWPNIDDTAYAAAALVHGDADNLFFRLLDDIKNGMVDDKSHSIRSFLLYGLYPDKITANQILDYFPTQRFSDLSASCFDFWHKKCLSVKEHIPTLLDQLVKKQQEITTIYHDAFKENWIENLLLIGLQMHGENISAERLCRWLTCVNETSTELQTWFHQHSACCQDMIEYSMYLYHDRNDLNLYMYKLSEKLYLNSPPIDMIDWFLEKAKSECKNKKLATWKWYFDEVYRHGNYEIDTLKKSVEKFSELTKYLEEKIDCLNKSREQEKILLQIGINKEINHDLISHFHHHLLAIREGTAHPSIMHDIAESYSGNLTNIYGSSPEDRLKKFLGNDQELINAAYSGIKKIIHRKDLPSEKEIINLATQDKMHLIRPACLMSIKKNYEENPANILSLNDRLIKTFLAFYFTISFEKNEHDDWASQLILARQLLAAKIFIGYISKIIAEKKDYILSVLDFIKKIHSHFFICCLPSLLQNLPIRKKISKGVINFLMRESILHLKKEMLEKIISNKLKKKSIDNFQKTYWLALGLLIHPDHYIKKLIPHIRKKQVYLYDFMIFLQDHTLNFSSMNGKSIELLLEKLTEDIHQNLSSKIIINLVYFLIDELINRQEGKDELERLIKIKKITPWHSIFRDALHTNKMKNIFKYPCVSDICKTLENAEPANLEDLQAITLSSLQRIADNICDGNTNAYRQYWTYDHSQKPIDRKHENECRDILLDHLREKLEPYKVQAEPEGSYADNTRADIKVSFSNKFNIPIEIKRDNNPDLWKSIYHQLIPKYTRDPQASGYGIYVVFWFGKGGIPNDPSGAGKVRSPQNLQQRLQNTLSKEQQRYIKVLVVDCSLPA